MKEYIQKFDPRKHMNKGDFEVFHYRGAIPEEKEVHHHDFYEIFFLLGGRVTYWAEGRTYDLKSGDMLLMNPMVLHRPIPDETVNDYGMSKDTVYCVASKKGDPTCTVTATFNQFKNGYCQ